VLTFKPWKVESLLQMLLGVFGGFALAGFLAAGLGYQPVAGRVDHAMLLVGAVTFHGAGLLWLHWFLQDHQLDWLELLGLRSRGVGRGFFICTRLNGLIFEWLVRQEIQPEMQSTVEALHSSVSPVWVIAFGVVSIILAPVVEEIVFRGVLYPVLKQQFALPAVAWLVSVFVFGASHLNLQAFLPLSVLALMLTWLYEKTDNLLAPICAHAVFNAINFALTIHSGALSSAGAAS
jgi:membrane protease YdiL (CAAX protease family)